MLKAQDSQQNQETYVNNVAIGFYIGYPIAGITGIYIIRSIGDSRTG
jgi:hypothetical protein